MKKYFALLLIVHTLSLTGYAGSTWAYAFIAGAHVNLGTQFNGINLQVGAATAFSESGGFSADLIGTLDYQLYWKKFGERVKAQSIIYEFKSTLGKGNTDDFVGLANGIMANHYFLSLPKFRHYNGVGFGWNKTRHFGALKKFSSARGSFLLRFSNQQQHFLVNFNNDFRAGPMRGKATDFGETGSLTMKYLQHNGLEVHTFGGTIELITPEPDYTRNPEAIGNSDFESKIVTHPKGAFPNLYHGNLFVFYNYQNAISFGELALGVDSKLSGAFIQNLLHDYFALYPRFEWPIHNKTKPYLQIKGGGQIFRSDQL